MNLQTTRALWALIAAVLAGSALAFDLPLDAGAARAGVATFDLFTESEALTWNTTRPNELKDFKTRDLRDDNSAPNCSSTPDNDADNPQIKITAPTVEKPLIAPIDLDLRFVPAGGAQIRPETLRICYMGLVSMDITKRITDRATVSTQGLHVSGALLPQGHHRLVILVADQRGRLARREAVFNVL